MSQLAQGQYGLSIPTKDETIELKKKIALLKDALIKQREIRQKIELDNKEVQRKCVILENQLQKKEQKNQNLLHESRQLKDILIRQKEEVKAINNEIAKSKLEAQGKGEEKSGWTSYLKGFWK